MLYIYLKGSINKFETLDLFSSLTNAMDDAILPQFILYESSKEIWDAASFMYSQKENKAPAFELQTRA
jgi:hypothetical protein